MPRHTRARDVREEKLSSNEARTGLRDAKAIVWWKAKSFSTKASTVSRASIPPTSSLRTSSAWCRRYDGGRSWYTGLGHTQASFAEAGILSHIGAGIEIAAGVLPSAACGVAPPTGGGTDVEVPIGGTVPGVLALTFGAAPSLGTFMPGVTKDYTASVAASVTSRAAAAALTVRDPSANATGHLVNGALAMPQALQVRANEGAFAPLSATGAALTLAAWSTPVGARPVTVEFKQPVAATDSLLTGSYGKTLTFTLSATTP